jgi:hypothetical protein
VHVFIALAAAAMAAFIMFKIAQWSGLSKSFNDGMGVGDALSATQRRPPESTAPAAFRNTTGSSDVEVLDPAKSLLLSAGRLPF